MIIHQRTFYCKVGHADHVVQLVKDFTRIADAVGARAHAERVYTDLTGKNDQVIWQVELDRIADWEEVGPAFFEHPDFASWFEQLTAHIDASEAQFFRLV
ncbi:MAG: hypothetical protein NVS2B16_26020 [Chloroflexota bacterium]